MIKPVTFQGIFNFKANLYALEVKSRFIDQSKANGYYKNYGNELAATIIGSEIQIGTGAFVIQGRMSEITTAESVTPPQLTNGYVGYVCLRQETYHPSDQDNTSLVCYVGSTLDAIPLTQQDTYQSTADETNLVYELPIYSFEISNGAITNLKKLIEPCGDCEKLKAIADNALSKAQSAVETSNNANATAERAEQTVTEQHQQMSEEIEGLAELIGDKQGTTVIINETPQASLPFNGEITDDKIVLFLDGGKS